MQTISLNETALLVSLENNVTSSNDRKASATKCAPILPLIVRLGWNYVPWRYGLTRALFTRLDDGLMWDSAGMIIGKGKP
jgi:hypothetical protein